MLVFIVFLFEWYSVAGENLPLSYLPQFRFLSLTTLCDSFYLLYISTPAHLFHTILVFPSNPIPELFILSHFYTCLQQFSSLTALSSNHYWLFLCSNFNQRVNLFLVRKQIILNLYWILITTSSIFFLYSPTFWFQLPTLSLWHLCPKAFIL